MMFAKYGFNEKMNLINSDILKCFKHSISEIESISTCRSDFIFSDHHYLLGYYAALKDFKLYFDEICDSYGFYELQFTPHEKGFHAII